MTPLSTTAADTMSEPATRAPTIRHPRRVLGAAVALGLWAELLFDGPQLGLSFPLFVLAALGALVLLAGREGLHGARRVGPLALPMVLLASFVAVRDSAELTALNLAACVALGGLLVQGFSGALGLADVKLWDLIARPLEGWARGVATAPALVREAVDMRHAGELARAHAGAAVRAIVVTVPVIVVFIALLSSGDVAFARALESIGAMLMPGGDGGHPVIFTLVATFVTSGLLAHALRRRKWPSPPPPVLPRPSGACSEPPKPSRLSGRSSPSSRSSPPCRPRASSSSAPS